jgi:NAD(P)-dependent dehydrogenase (short-subunit alcohol dehydrogenase family)
MDEQPVTVVTGGGRGIGAAICVRLAQDGHDVVVGYRSNRSAADAVADRVRAAGRRAIAVRVETSDASSVAEFFEQSAAFGTITGLVNNAGVGGPVGPLIDADVEGMRRSIDVNVMGYLICAQRALREFARTDGGSIVNISSAAATLGSPNTYVYYAAAKAAVDAMTVGLSKEVASAGVRVNGVAPGVIWTEFHADPERPAKLASTIPMGRAGQPKEIAGAVSWLLSADASFTTGTIIRVAGGM